MFPRLWRRTMHRIRNDVELWNGNRETWRDQFRQPRDDLLLVGAAPLQVPSEWPARFAGDARVVRLRTDAETAAWLVAQAADRPGPAARGDDGPRSVDAQADRAKEYGD